MSDDAPKVIAGTVTAKGDHFVLTMTTVDDLTVTFLLDDLALSLLMLTGGPLLHVAKSHVKPTIFPRTCEVSE